MSGEECLNCGDPADDIYEVLVRKTEREVALCDECHEAIAEKLTD